VPPDDRHLAPGDVGQEIAGNLPAGGLVVPDDGLPAPRDWPAICELNLVSPANPMLDVLDTVRFGHIKAAIAPDHHSFEYAQLLPRDEGFNVLGGPQRRPPRQLSGLCTFPILGVLHLDRSREFFSLPLELPRERVNYPLLLLGLPRRL
jgi:hypothetical protein